MLKISFSDILHLKRKHGITEFIGKRQVVRLLNYHRNLKNLLV